MKVKNITAKLLLMTVSLALTLMACKKDRQAEMTLQADKLKKDWDATVQTVAKDVSGKLNSRKFRTMLKHEVLLRFDGDANILLSSLIKRLPKYLAYESSGNAVARSINEDLLSGYNFDIIRQAAEDFPQMQIAVQTDAESWDASTFTPGVVYLTSTYDEATSTTISGFDPNQNPITVSTTEDPTVNYVVISQNERTTIRNGEVRLTVSNCPVEAVVYNAPYNPEAVQRLIFPDCDGDGGGDSGGGTGGHPQYVGTGHDGVLPALIDRQIGSVVPSSPEGTVNRVLPVGTFNGITVYRKNYRHEKMREIRCDDLKEIEGWPAGAPEIRMHVFEQNVLNPSENLQIFKEQFLPDRRKHIDNKWWDAEEVTMHLWDYTGTGTKASFGYYEYDPVLIPNETLVAIGQIVVDLLFLSFVDSTTIRNRMLIYGSIRQSVGTGIRSLKKKNGMSEYIGKDDYIIFNDEDQFNHSPGGTKFKTWPDL